jgi:hypothetical protein
MSSTVSEPTPLGVPGFVRTWDRFWFDPVKPTTLGLIRIFTGAIVLYVHLLYTFQLVEFFGPDGWVNLKTANLLRHESPVTHMSADWVFAPPGLPPDGSPERLALERYGDQWSGTDRRTVFVEGTPVWSVWFHVTDPTAMAWVHGFILLAMLMFTLGLCTRITSVLTWMGSLMFIHRSSTTLFGMDTMMNILLLYLMIGPSGAAYSLDRWLSHWWEKRKIRLSGLPAPVGVPPQPMRSARFALRLLQIHFCFIYMGSGLSKLLGSTWWGGTALWYTMANYEFAPFQFQLYHDYLIWLTGHRLLWEMMTSGGALFTLMLEIGFPFLVWIPRLRWLVICGAVMLHTGIAVTMGLTTFGMLMLCMLFAFLPVEAVEGVVARLGQRKKT